MKLRSIFAAAGLAAVLLGLAYVGGTFGDIWIYDPAQPMHLAQVSPATYKALTSPPPKAGQSDGLFYKVSDGSLSLVENGTDVFNVGTTGNAQFDGDLTVTGNDISFGNGGTVSNATNGAIAISEASEDLVCTFTANTATLTSTTGVTTLAAVSLDSTFKSVGLENGETISNGTNGKITFAGAGGTNNENLLYDYETTANNVLVTSGTGVTAIDYGTIDLVTDKVSATATGTLTLASGGASGEDLVLTSSANAMAISSSTGLTTINLSGVQFGFTVAAAGNQACDTTCSGGKKCMFGWDQGTTVFVACNSALADTCVCSTT